MTPEPGVPVPVWSSAEGRLMHAADWNRPADGRAWRDMVGQARGLIPRSTPEWTDHSPNDLGMTLIRHFLG